ncbi:MAG: D-hexose-6-phosphate mutarotase [Victivallales bacterium]|nr:D-hexose-6-phosphate mutarotase [Victivallales bacterium]
MNTPVKNLIMNLTRQFSNRGNIYFELTKDKYPIIKVRNDSATASIALYGAQLMSYIPSGEKPVLWLKASDEFIKGQAVQGGIPVCWPWFGTCQKNAEMPLHGFVRTVLWQLDDVIETDRKKTELVFSLSNKLNKALPQFHDFRLELRITIGSELKVKLESFNTGTDSFLYTEGLHSFFNIGDIAKVRIKGVDAHDCFNKESGNEERQCGDLTFNGLTTRIFHRISHALIHDPVLKREIEVKVSGGNSIVVWNPGQETGRRFPMFIPGDERTLLCVEAANPAGCDIRLHPGESHFLATEIKILEKLS